MGHPSAPGPGIRHHRLVARGLVSGRNKAVGAGELPGRGAFGLWVIPVLGGAPREIRESAVGWSVSPDGSLIAFTSTSLSSDIWLMGPNGEDSRKIVTADEGESLNWVVWSPDSRRIAYER